MYTLVGYIHPISGNMPLTLMQVTLADVVQIHPVEFGKESLRSIEDFINAKYADKVIHKIGLCLGFHSLISASEGLIGHGTGIVNVNVDFRLIVFRPFKGEIIRATITSSTPSGIALSVDFYEDLLVPPETLFENTAWQQDDSGTWAFVWKADDNDGGFNDFYFDNAESCLLRIEDEQWHDASPDAAQPEQEDEEEDEEAVTRRTPPYLLRGSMMHAGLGPTLWWVGEGTEETATAIEEEGDDTMIGA